MKLDKLTPGLLSKLTPEQRADLAKLYADTARSHLAMHDTLMNLSLAIATGSIKDAESKPH